MSRPFLCGLSLLLLAVGEVMAGKLSLTDTITWGGDNSRSGYQSTHNMDPSVVGSAQFGQLWKAVLPGNYRGYTEQIYSQSLLYTLDDGIQYVFVSTTQNNIYKINAKTGAIVASRNLHVPFLTADLDGCVDISPTVGVTATGVIDPSTDTWYLTAKTYLDQSDQVKGRLTGRYYFHAIDVNTLNEKTGFPKELEGIIATNNANRMFQSGNAHQRPALLHTGQYIYAGFASHCVQYNFTGWIMGWDKTSGTLVESFTTEAGPEKNTVPGGGVWMSGGGIATDNKGSMYFATGNGYASQLSGTPVPGRQPPTSLEEAAVNMKINDDGSLKVVDFFMPWEKVQLDGADKDLGTTPLELLQPDVFTCPKVKRMGVVTGKSGKMYILNLDNLGGYQQGPNKLDAVPQVVQNENSVYAGAGVYPLEGGYIYINVIQYPTHVFKFSCDGSGNPQFTKVADSPEKNAYVLGVGHGTTTSLNGQAGTGLYWVSDVDGYNLRVYSAVPVNGKLQLIKSANVAGITKFSRAVFGDSRAYLGTVQGALYCFGSPVNLPLTCTAPNDFGSVVINSTSAAKTIQCQANVNTQITAITIKSANFQISSLPTLPFSLNKDQNISFQAVFAPSAPGPLSNDVLLSTINGVSGYSNTVPVSLKGVGDSLAPLLAVNPNSVTFEGVITGQQAGGTDQSIILANRGDGVLHITGIDYSIVKEGGTTITPNVTANGVQIGPFTFKNVPTTIPGNSEIIVLINFDPATSGNFAVYVTVKSDGGSKVFDVFGTAGTYPVAVLEFQAADGSGKWIPYTNNDPPFTFGDVYEQETKIRKMRLTNNGSSSAAALSITVSKPPFGVAGLIAAQNGVDLAEGTILAAGESATADLFCSAPKSQVNTDSYNGTAVWTMNTGDPNFGKQYIQFTCRAVSRQVGPLYPNGSAIYRYDGCWKENNPGRQLKVQLWGQNSNNTNDACISACATQSYTYAGTQYVNECWCGNKIPKLLVNNTECNYACSGDDTETCGGNGYFHDASYISLFSTTPGQGGSVTPSGPAVVPSVGSYNYSGCYTEGSSGRALGAKNTASDQMTVEKCAAFCVGFNYFGIEYASECYCDNAFGVGSTKTLETDCSMTCSGNDTQICGAGQRLTVYNLTGQAGASSSATSGVSATTSSSSSSPTATGPIAVPTAGNFSYQGCYTEGTNGRALAAAATASADMTVEKCATFCAGYTYMGVEYSSECYCANIIADGAVLTSSGCSMICGGNSTELCGGSSRLSFYKATAQSSITSSASAVTKSSTSTASSPTSSGPSAVQTAGVFSYVGCYSEGTNGRALADKATAAGTMTVEVCAAFCSDYAFMGIEYSTECYCGNTIAVGSAPAADGCTMTCGGNGNEFCGGPNRLNFYKAGVKSSTTSSISVTSVTSSTSAISTSKTSSGPSAVQTAGTFSYTGCYTEGNNVRALADKATAANAMTVELCASFCAGYTYMGVEYSTECYCGNLIGAGSALTDSGCSMTCGGNVGEYCGGPNRLNFYKAGSSSLSRVISSTTTSSLSSSSATINITGISLTSSSSSSTTATSTSGTSVTLSSSLTSSTTATNTSGTNVSSSASSTSSTTATSTSGTSVSSSSSSSSTSSTTATNTSGTSVSLSSSSSSSSKSSTTTTNASGTNVSSSSSSTLTSTSKSTSGTSTKSSSTTSSSSTPSPTIVQGNANFTYTACYVEGSSRALPNLVLADDQMTVERCLQACYQYTYAGLEYGRECWCANALASSATQATAESQCNKKCAGDSSELCGAGNRLSLYTHNPQAKPQAKFALARPAPIDSSDSQDSTSSSISETSSSTLTSSSTASPGFVTSSTSVTSISSTASASASTSSSFVSSKSSTTSSFVSSTSSTNSQSSLTSSSSISSMSATGSKSSSSSSTVELSSSSSSATPTSFTPTPGQIVDGWAYLGCANQTSPYALSGMRKSSPGEMTLDICQEYCLKNYYGLSGVENGDTCFCGNGLQSYSALGQTDCHTPCAGNSSETCGGKDAQGNTYLSVWNSTSTTIIPTFVKQVGYYPLQGCYRNANASSQQPPQHLLAAATYTNATGMTVESCVGYCIARDYPLAALEKGDSCYCGSALAASGSLWDDVRCTKTCAGNSREFCGGPDGVLVYKMESQSVANGAPKSMNKDNTPLG